MPSIAFKNILKYMSSLYKTLSEKGIIIYMLFTVKLLSLLWEVDLGLNIW